MNRTYFVVLLALVGTAFGDNCRFFDNFITIDLLDPIIIGLGSDELTLVGDEASLLGFGVSISGGRIKSLRSLMPWSTPSEEYTASKLCFTTNGRTIHVVIEFNNLVTELEELVVKTPYGTIPLGTKDTTRFVLPKTTADSLVRIDGNGIVTLDQFNLSFGSVKLQHGTGFAHKLFEKFINHFAPSILSVLRRIGVEHAVQENIKAAVAEALTKQQENISKSVPTF